MTRQQRRAAAFKAHNAQVAKIYDMPRKQRRAIARDLAKQALAAR